ncbi:hypothetical protein TRAPUB_6233 [Trametes pubescens]|uniref:Uncharacterized protein n=1 Tax=Trametes pubescens TaxID=154538 RepID=A0A1M2V6I2_TRAPU|nr:hypothetical protein TRAPUB_6233 [Trametes pubescens]
MFSTFTHASTYGKSAGRRSLWSGKSKSKSIEKRRIGSPRLNQWSPLVPRPKQNVGLQLIPLRDAMLREELVRGTLRCHAA